MTKARDLANLISTGNPLADGALAASEVSGLHAVATSGAYANLTGTPTLATVATSGAYANLTGTPSLATVATSGAYSDLSGSPSGDSLLPSQSGNTGKFLTSNGSAASWADAGGGATELLATASPSNVTTTTLTLPTGYFSFLIIIDKLVPTSDANTFVKPQGASSVTWRYVNNITDKNGTNIGTGSATSGDGIRLNYGTQASSTSDSNYTGWSGTVQLYGAKDSGMCYATWQGSFIRDNGRTIAVAGSGRANTAEVFTSATVGFNTNTLSGSIKLYGIKE